jgi:molybdopterin-guanine dinucleotide biosynthesis protein A
MQSGTAATDDIGVLILAGGEATRLPGKLELAAGGLPMIVRVYRNVSAGRTTYISCKATFPPEIDRLLPAPMVVDRWSLRGPLAGLVTTMGQMRTRLVFAVAGDAPFVDAAFIDSLSAEWRDRDDEALVPVHPLGEKTQMEPLAALYDRHAFLREGIQVLRSGRGALRGVLDRLRTRTIEVRDPRIFTNVNTPGDYEVLRASWGVAQP